MLFVLQVRFPESPKAFLTSHWPTMPHGQASRDRGRPRWLSDPAQNGCGIRIFSVAEAYGEQVRYSVA